MSPYLLFGEVFQISHKIIILFNSKFMWGLETPLKDVDTILNMNFPFLQFLLENLLVLLPNEEALILQIFPGMPMTFC